MKLRLPRLQFSLRTLIIAMIILSGIVGWQGSRYVRYHERRKLNSPMIEAQAAFAMAHVEVDFETTSKRRSILDQWDEFWFGELDEFDDLTADRLSFRTDSFDQKSIANTLRAAKSLSLLTNIEQVEGYHRQPGSPLPNEFLHELLALPQLRELTIRQGAIFDDSAVEALPSNSPLQKLHVAMPQLTPHGAAMLLQKAPSLSAVWLSEKSLSPAVVDTLNRRLSLPPDNDQTTHTRIFSATSDHNLGESIEQGLQLLHVPYELILNFGPTNPCAHPYGTVLPGTLPKTYSTLRAKTLIASVADRVTIERFPELVAADIYETTDFHLTDCPRLERLSLKLCHQIQLEKLPALTQLKIEFCGKLQIQDCAQLTSVDYLGFRMPGMPPELVLQRLPSLKSLSCFGTGLTLANVPLLEEVTLYNPTTESLAAVRQLPKLRKLNLHFYEGCPELSADELWSVATTSSLQELHFHGSLPVHAELQSALLKQLEKVPSLRFSRN